MDLILQKYQRVIGQARCKLTTPTSAIHSPDLMLPNPSYETVMSAEPSLGNDPADVSMGKSVMTSPPVTQGLTTGASSKSRVASRVLIK